MQALHISSRMKNKIDAEYFCGCWFEYDTSEEVTQSCLYHKKKLLMRSDTKKDFSDNLKPLELSRASIKK